MRKQKYNPKKKNIEKLKSYIKFNQINTKENEHCKQRNGK